MGTSLGAGLVAAGGVVSTAPTIQVASEASWSPPSVNQTGRHARPGRCLEARTVCQFKDLTTISRTGVVSLEDDGTMLNACT